MAWLATPEGQRDAYRRDEHVLPSQFADRAAWDAYLDGLRQHKPATLDDVRPRLAGVNLVAEIDPDFVDPSRINMRLAIENGALQRSEEHTSELQSLMRISYAVFCLKKKNKKLHTPVSS